MRLHFNSRTLKSAFNSRCIRVYFPVEVVEISLSYIVLIATILSQKSYRRKISCNSNLQNNISMFRITIIHFSKIIQSHFLTNLYATCNFRIANIRQLQSAKCTKDVQKNDIDWALPKEMALLHHRVDMVLHLKRSDHKI